VDPGTPWYLQFGNLFYFIYFYLIHGISYYYFYIYLASALVILGAVGVCGCCGWVIYHAHEGTFSAWSARFRAWRRRAAVAAWQRMFPPPVPPPNERRDMPLFRRGGGCPEVPHQQNQDDHQYEVLLLEDIFGVPVPSGALPIAPIQEAAVLQVDNPVPVGRSRTRRPRTRPPVVPRRNPHRGSRIPVRLHDFVLEGQQP
jgi:hypothetical protein